MKKIIVLLACLMMISSVASAALFSNVGTTKTTTIIGGADFIPSTNVYVDIFSGTADYMAAAKHTNGDKAYASGSGETNITEVTTDCVKGTAITDGIVTDATTVPGACS